MYNIDMVLTIHFPFGKSLTLRAGGRPDSDEVQQDILKFERYRHTLPRWLKVRFEAV